MRPRLVAILLILTLVMVGPAAIAQVPSQGATGPDGLKWEPAFSYAGATLVVQSSDGQVIERAYAPDEPLYFSIYDDMGDPLPDGGYGYELVLTPDLPASTLAAMALVADDAGRGMEGAGPQIIAPETVSGHFTVLEGALVDDTPAEATDDGVPDSPSVGGTAPSGTAGGPGLSDIVHADDVIIQSSLCVGFDCVNGENFGFDTLRLKENNLRIKFQDTSNSASFPSVDWQITANDSSNGGANKFSIEDIDGARIPLTIEAGSQNNALYVDSNRGVGIGTSTPQSRGLDINIGDTPTLRLAQNGSWGWSPQTWDVAGNESNFFIRDVTNGKLPFRIKPGAPENSLFVAADGKIGLGTQSPSYPLHLRTASSTDAIVAADRTGSATAGLVGGSSAAAVGSLSDHNLNLITNNATRMTIDTDGRVSIGDVNPITNGYALEAFGRMQINLPEAPNGSRIALTTPGSNPGVVLIEGDGTGGIGRRWDMSVDSSDLVLTDRTGKIDVLTLEAGGEVGIGTTSPSANLTIRAASGQTSDVFRIENSSGGFLAAFEADGDMRIKGTLSQNQTSLPKPSEASQDEVVALNARIDELQAENQALADRLSALEALVAELAAPSEAPRR